MFKSVLYGLLLLTTTVRFVDVVYLLSRESTNLPIEVFVVTSVMVLYGIALLVNRFIGSIRLKQLMLFFVIQTVAFAFNLAYVAIVCPLEINILETIAVGTFLDILINCCVVYLCVKQMRDGVLTAGTAQ